MHQQYQMDCLLQAELSSPIDCWLKIDTGMHRLGISVDDVDVYFDKLEMCFNVADVFLMSHFSQSDDTININNYNQLVSFLNVSNNKNAVCSMANSAAIMRLPKSHFDVVRPGIMLYGSSPFKETTAVEPGLQAVMQFESMLIDIKQVKAGESIGYGSTFTCEKNTLVGVVAAGYGDGYPRSLSGNGADVLIAGQRCPLLGRVTMDQIMVDVTDLEPCPEAGDDVVLIGGEITAAEVAEKAGTIVWEILTGITQRVVRIYKIRSRVRS